MNDRRTHYRSTRHSHASHEPPVTWRSIAVIAGLVALVPLTLFALAHPAVVTASIAGVTAGLFARPMYRKLTRRTPAGSERPSDAVGPTAIRD